MALWLDMAARATSGTQRPPLPNSASHLPTHPHNHPPQPRRHLPVNRAVWQDVKGAMVLAGNYEEAVKMMGDMNFLQVSGGGGSAGCKRA